MKRILTIALIFVGCSMAARAPARRPTRSAPVAFSRCDVNQDGDVNIADYYREAAEILGNVPQTAAGDVNSDGLYNVADLQIVAVAVLGLGCSADAR